MRKTLNLQYSLQLASILVTLLLMAGCGSNDSIDNNKQQSSSGNLNTSKRSNLNISILLDLSDRIDSQKYPNPAMEFYQRDVGYVKSIIEAFVDHLRHKRIITMNDRIQVFFDPPPSSKSINDISQKLKVKIDKNNVTNDFLASIEKEYPILIDSIYKMALRDDNFIGSDTWGFFDGKIKDYCISEEYQNVLFIFTDGYIYHKLNKRKDSGKTNYLTPEDIRQWKLNNSTWESRYTTLNLGYIPATSGLEGLKIMVLGINPHISGNPYEKDVLLKYWNDWLASMGVSDSNYKILTADLPSDLNPIIMNFVHSASTIQ